METLTAHSHNSTKLNTRTLWFDGDSTVSVDKLRGDILKGLPVDSLFVEKITDEISQYNKLVSKTEKVSIKPGVAELSFGWNIPEEYKKLDVVAFIGDKLIEEDGLKPDAYLRQVRCAAELELYKKLGLFDTIKALIYIINVLTEKDVVWGVGRGSSVSSYVLYLIGVHDIDSFYYDLDIADFLRI